MEQLEFVEQQIRRIIAEELQVEEEEVRSDATIAELGGDSLKALQILAALEVDFDIAIEDEDAMEIVSFASAVTIVNKYLQQ